MNRVLVDSEVANLKYLFLILGIGFAQPWRTSPSSYGLLSNRADPTNGSWMALNAQSAGERSVTLAVMIMSANTAGIIGSQLFREDDGPLYRNGWGAILGLVTVALVTTVAANVMYMVLNRRGKTRGKGQVYQQ